MVHSEEVLLIVHADDLGMAHSINTAVYTAMSSGCVTSASIMPVAPAFEEAANLFRSRPDLDLGVHLTLTSEWNKYGWSSVSQPAHVPSLLADNGHLWRNTHHAIAHLRPDEVEVELRAQIERALEAGLHISHLDCHMFCLLRTPELLAVLLRVAESYALPAAVPRQFLPRLAASANVAAPVLPALDAIYLISDQTAPHTWLRAYCGTVAALGSGLHQIIVHPGLDDDELRTITEGHIAYGAGWRARDLEVVTSRAFAAAISNSKARLTSWGNLVRADSARRIERASGMSSGPAIIGRIWRCVPPTAKPIFTFFGRLEETVPLLGFRARFKPAMRLAVADLSERRRRLACGTGDLNPSVSSDIIGLFNNAGLLLLRTGDIRQAINICRAALNVCSAQVLSGRFLPWAHHLLEPYLNLGRAAAFLGRPNPCVRHCDDIRQYLLGLKPLRIGHISLECEPPANSSHESMVATYSWASESVKALLMVRDFGSLRNLIGAFKQLDRHMQVNFRHTILEAEIKCSIGMQLWERADSLLDALKAVMVGTDQHAIALLRHSRLIQVGDVTRACAEAAALWRVICTNAESAWFAYIAYRCALALATSGAGEIAVEAAIAAEKAAAVAGDEALRMRIRCLLIVVMAAASYNASAGGGPKVSSLAESVRADLDHCYYRIERTLGHVVLSHALSELPGRGSRVEAAKQRRLAATAAATSELHILKHLAGCVNGHISLTGDSCRDRSCSGEVFRYKDLDREAAELIRFAVMCSMATSVKRDHHLELKIPCHSLT